MSPRVDVSTPEISSAIGAATCLRPGFQQDVRGFIGEFFRAEKEAGQRRDHDQKRKQGHQRGQRDMARDRPAIVGDEMAKGSVCDSQ